jgi:hypothetical protein
VIYDAAGAPTQTSGHPAYAVWRATRDDHFTELDDINTRNLLPLNARLAAQGESLDAI